MKPLSLANRVSLLVALTAVVLLAAAAAVMDHLVDAEMQRRFDSTLLVQAHALAALIEPGPGGLVMQAGGRPMQHALLPSRPQSLAARCQDGREMSEGAHAADARSWLQSVNDTVDTDFTTVGQRKSRQRAVMIGFDPFDEPATGATSSAAQCRLVLMQPSAALDDILLETDAILVAVPMTVLVLLLLLSPWLVRRGLEPLAILREHMGGIGPQQPGQRLPPSRVREIEPLVQRFNEVLARMDEGVLRERRFAGAVAHETRTRLAELRTLVEVERRHPSQRPLDELLGEVGEISAELESTVSALLLLTRLEAGIEPLEASPVEAGKLLEAQLVQHRSRIAARGLEIEFAPKPGLTVDTDPDLLRLVVANLLANAVSHAPRADRIRIQLEAGHLCISNHAPGLGAGDIAHLGQRHWQKQHQSDQHSGLGLSLAGAAARALGMRLHFALDAEHRLAATLDWSGIAACEQDCNP